MRFKSLLTSFFLPKATKKRCYFPKDSKTFVFVSRYLDWEIMTDAETKEFIGVAILTKS